MMIEFEKAGFLDELACATLLLPAFRGFGITGVIRTFLKHKSCFGQDAFLNSVVVFHF